MRHNLTNIQSENTLRPEPGLLALEKFGKEQGIVSGSLMPPDYQKEKFCDAAPFRWFPEGVVGAINHKKGNDQGRNGVNYITFEEPINELRFIVKNLADFYFKPKFILILKN